LNQSYNANQLINANSAKYQQKVSNKGSFLQPVNIILNTKNSLSLLSANISQINLQFFY